MLELLISKGVDINAQCINYQNIIILFLIKTISNKSRKFDEKNKTPLYIAANNNLKEIVEILISKGADVNLQNSNSKKMIIISSINLI